MSDASFIRFHSYSQGPLAFGAKGRPASAGKPRIPADAEIIFEVEMVGLPGKEPELIDLIGDDY
jgi:peptidylprolyl isomerase